MPAPHLTDQDRFQVAAFHAFFKAARIGGLDIDTAFTNAIINSSDEETERVLANDPDAIQRWLDFVPPEPETDEALYETDEALYETDEAQTERIYDEDY